MLVNTIKRVLFRIKRNAVVVRGYGNQNMREETIQPDSEKENLTDTKILRLAIIGVPNAGKSTFINNLMDRTVCPTSSKVHTTRTRAKAILNEGPNQIIFVDTPGIVDAKERKRFKLESSFEVENPKYLRDVDIIGVIHDASNRNNRERLDFKVLRILEANKEKPSFLVLNKIDAMKTKRKLLDLTRLLTENHLGGKRIPGKPLHTENRGWRHFDDIFMVSALMREGLDEVKEYLVSRCRPGKLLYPADAWTDQSVEDVISRTVKAVLLQNLPQEIPYVVKPEIELLERNDDGVITTVVLVHCGSERMVTYIRGISDGRLRIMTQQAQQCLQDAFKNFVRIQIALDAK